MATLLSDTHPSLRGLDLSNSFAGARGASSARCPDQIPEGSVFLSDLGIVTNPGAHNMTNGAAAEVRALMRTDAYRNGDAATVERVRQLFGFLHPED